MPSIQTIKAFFSGFSKLNRAQRLNQLLEIGALTEDDIYFLETSVDPTITDLADKFIENTIGCFPLPLGIATHFHIDEKDYLIPMAVEETSIIAAASKTAKWIRSTGNITTSIQGECVIGQVQLPEISDFKKLKKLFNEHKATLINELNSSIAKRLFERGGGVQELTLRELPQQNKLSMAVVHVLLNPCDAMGANILSQICEALKPRIEALTQERVGLCILSNLADTKLTQARIIIQNIDTDIGCRIEEASQFAKVDPYRATTHNKGVLNGIDPILIATGNDWRAVEAGIHAYATRQGQYQPVTEWSMKGNDLHGFFEAPVIVGTVGGVTQLHPTAKLCLKLLGVQSANELSRVIAAVGLTQNLGALRALSQEGICQGHMKLHIDNLLLAAGAKAQQMTTARKALEEILKQQRKVSVKDAEGVLASI